MVKLRSMTTISLAGSRVRLLFSEPTFSPLRHGSPGSGHSYLSNRRVDAGCNILCKCSHISRPGDKIRRIAARTASTVSFVLYWSCQQLHRLMP